MMKIPYNCSHFKNLLLCHVKLFISEYYSNIPFYLHVCVYLQSRYFLFSKIVFLASTGYSLREKKRCALQNCWKWIWTEKNCIASINNMFSIAFFSLFMHEILGGSEVILSSVIKDLYSPLKDTTPVGSQISKS